MSMNLADQGAKVVGYQPADAGRGSQGVTPRDAASLTAMRWLRPYGLAVAFVAIALGLALVAELQAIRQAGSPAVF